MRGLIQTRLQQTKINTHSAGSDTHSEKCRTSTAAQPIRWASTPEVTIDVIWAAKGYHVAKFRTINETLVPPKAKELDIAAPILCP